MKNTANIITALRIPLAVTIVLIKPFSVLFWACYIAAGLSDIFDGMAAERLKQKSDFGAKLDSAADFVFALAIAVVILVNVKLPTLLWLCGACIALLRVIGYVIGYMKYRTFSPLHTYANKAVGVMIFLFPLLYSLLGIEVGGAFLCVAAFVSALEELLITVLSDKLNRDRRSLFFL